MKPFSPRLLILTLGLALVPVAVQAGPTWSLDFQFGSNALVSDSGRSLLEFKPHNTTSSAKSANPVVSYLDVLTSAHANHPDHFTHQFYLMVLRLTDLVSHQSRGFFLVGDLTGTVSVSSANLTNHMLTRSSFTGIHLGHNIYSFSFGPFIDPNMLRHLPGIFDTHVSFQPMPTSASQPASTMMAMRAGPMSGSAAIGGVSQSPEPSAVVLAMLGISGTGMWGWWRRRGGAASSVDG
jgi:hypothetical protein